MLLKNAYYFKDDYDVNISHKNNNSCLDILLYKAPYLTYKLQSVLLEQDVCLHLNK